MRTLIRNQKGAVLIATYIVILMLLALTGAFFSRTVQEKQLVRKQNDALQALYNAEAGLAYACVEASQQGWTWYTHIWDPDTSTLQPIHGATHGGCSQGGCYVLPASSPDDGCYAAVDGSFLVKAFDDPNPAVSYTTVIYSKGISQNIERVIEYRVSRRSIYDYYMWTPYDLVLYNQNYNCAGGGIHTNKNITLQSSTWGTNAPRLNDISELSTGPNMTVQYQCADQYSRPQWLDAKYGTDQDALAPLPELDFPHRWTEDNPYPYQGGWTDSRWPTAAIPWRWPPTDWCSIDTHFSGSPVINSLNRLDYGITFSGRSKYNAWIRSVKKDDYGNVLVDHHGHITSLDTVEIPAHLSQSWDWDKYWYDAPATEQQSIQFVDGTGTPAEPAYWEELIDQLVARGERPERLDPDILDGIYGNDPEIVAITNTNSMMQDSAWKEFVDGKDLTGVVMANDEGFILSEPSFATTYKSLAQRHGSYYNLNMEEDSCQTWQNNPDDATARFQCLDKSIDQWVDNLNSEGRTVAQKVKFIDSTTVSSVAPAPEEFTIVLEIDIQQMAAAGNYPLNGILYSEIPLRINNARTLPQNCPGFNVIGEENLYLKGSYNNPHAESRWMPSAIISKKRIYTLSADFNDPQVAPAMVDFLQAPYICVADIGEGNFREVDRTFAGAQWVSEGGLYQSIHSFGDYYPDIPDTQKQILLNTIRDKRAAYYAVFDSDDPTATGTFNWTRTGDGTLESYTWGMMPNRVQDETTYNCLMAAYRLDPQQPGEHLERWQDRFNHTISKNMNGAYFQLEEGFWDGTGGQFSAFEGDYVLRESDDSHLNRAMPGDRRGRLAWIDWNTGNGVFNQFPNFRLRYDTDFITASAASKPIFFGGGPPPSWREIPLSSF